VRSSHGHFVKASGLRWLNFMVLTPVPWTSLVKALPILTLLEPSERSDHQKGRRHKLLTDWFRQGVLQIFRWLPGAILSLSATAPSPSMNSPMSSLAERHLPAACGLTPACTPRRTFKSGFNE